MASLTEILILRGVVPIESLDAVSGAWGQDEGAVKALVEKGVVTEVQLASARAAQADLPFVELLEYPVDRTAVSLVPAAMCRRYQIIPIAIIGDILTTCAPPPACRSVPSWPRRATSGRPSTATTAPTAN
jgi:type IV pilus assembly protein PilB